MVPVIEDQVIGTLRYDEKLGWYETAALVQSAKVTCYLQAATDQELASVLTRCRAMWPNLQRFVVAAASYAAGCLLELKNEYWLGEEEKPVTHQEFQ